MDAKIGDHAFTPRQGKPVEINALWYHALVLMGEEQLATKVKASFVKQFWINPFKGLCDVVSGSVRDISCRPNQIFAVSLANSPLDLKQQQTVVEVVRQELLTPFGLRTLAKSDPKFRGKYSGPQFQRDEAYHNGTIWPWLIGPFLEAQRLHRFDQRDFRGRSATSPRGMFRSGVECCRGAAVSEDAEDVTGTAN